MAYGTAEIDPPCLHSNHVLEEDIGPFLAERLDRHRSDMVAEHLDECYECRKELYEVLEYGRLYAAKARHEEPRRHAVSYAAGSAGQLRVVKPYASRLLPILTKAVSSSGIRIEIPVEVPSETQVQVLMEAAILLGEIRYCVPAGSRFHIGVHIDVVHYTPHQLDEH